MPRKLIHIGSTRVPTNFTARTTTCNAPAVVGVPATTAILPAARPGRDVARRAKSRPYTVTLVSGLACRFLWVTPSAMRHCPTLSFTAISAPPVRACLVIGVAICAQLDTCVSPSQGTEKER